MHERRGGSNGVVNSIHFRRVRIDIRSGEISSFEFFGQVKDPHYSYQRLRMLEMTRRSSRRRLNAQHHSNFAVSTYLKVEMQYRR